MGFVLEVGILSKRLVINGLSVVFFTLRVEFFYHESLF